MKYKNLILIGTSHISPESAQQSADVILKYKPEIVALELDKGRLHALLTGDKRKPTLKDARRIGWKGWFFSIIGAWIEKKLANKIGVFPGVEMITAYKTAIQSGAKIELIDQEIEITLKRFSQEFTWKEKINLAIDIIRGLFTKEKIKIDLTKVPPKELIRKLLKDTKKRYPNVYRVLVEERNEYMAKKLAYLMKKNEGIIVALVGAGHEEEIIRLVKKNVNLIDVVK